jgi:hypothetical protein
MKGLIVNTLSVYCCLEPVDDVATLIRTRKVDYYEKENRHEKTKNHAVFTAFERILLYWGPEGVVIYEQPFF